jgi:hypothetical protein
MTILIPIVIAESYLVYILLKTWEIIATTKSLST